MSWLPSTFIIRLLIEKKREEPGNKNGTNIFWLKLTRVNMAKIKPTLTTKKTHPVRRSQLYSLRL